MTQTNDPASGTPPFDDDIDLQRYVAAFRRRAGLFTAVATVVCLIVLALMLGQTSVYTATANLQIKTRKEQVIAGPADIVGTEAALMAYHGPWGGPKVWSEMEIYLTMYNNQWRIVRIVCRR